MGEQPEVVTIQDVICMAVPEQFCPPLPVMATSMVASWRTLVYPFLLKNTMQSVLNQYGDSPPEVRFEKIDWLITDASADVEEFQPAHDCVACRAGNDQALAYLRENPGRYIAMGNLTYTETWKE